MIYIKRLKGTALIAAGVWLVLVQLAHSANDEIAENREYFTPEQLVAWVWQRNPGIAELSAAAEVAVYRIDPAGAWDDPTLAYAVAPRATGGAGRGPNQKIEFSQLLPWPGTLAARQSVAQHAADAASRDIESLQLQLAATAKSAYAEWYFIQRALQIHHATRMLLGELRSSAETRYAAGNGSQRDALHAEVEAAKLDRHLLQLERRQVSVKAHINALLDRDTTAPIPMPIPLWNLKAIPELSELQQAALALHPELRRVDSELAAQTAEVVLAEKAFFPDVRFTAGYNSLWGDPDKRSIVGVSINLPFDRSKRRAVLRSAKANVRRAESRRNSVSTGLIRELTQAHAAAVESIAAVSLYEKSLLPLAAEYFEAALADYTSGSGTFLSLITAEREKLDTEEALERNRADVLRHTAVLERWTGRGLGERFSANHRLAEGETP